jgi:mRNA-capping enzyme
MVSWKADGTRYMMLILGKDQIFMIDRDNAIFKVSNVLFPKRKDLSSHLTDVLVDGEVVLDEVNGVKYPRFLIYDIIRYGNDQVGKVPFGLRLMCIRNEIIAPRHAAITKGMINKEREPFSIRIKVRILGKSNLLFENLKRSVMSFFKDCPTVISTERTRQDSEK